MASLNIDEGDGILRNPEGQQNNRGNEWLCSTRVWIGSFLGIVLVAVIIDSLTTRHVEAATMSFLGWVEDHPLSGVLAVIVAFWVATILFIPGGILSIGAGFAFGSAFSNEFQGVALAVVAVFIGASLGSMSAFFLGRYLFREKVVQLASRYPAFQAVDRALEGNGFRIMLLLRLSPLIPYNALDYMSGVTTISASAYALALVGMLPGTILYCSLGATANSLATASNTTTENPWVKWGTLIFGLFFAILGVSVASYYSKKELDKILAEDDTPNRPLTEDVDGNNRNFHQDDPEQSSVPSPEQLEQISHEGYSRSIV